VARVVDPEEREIEVLERFVDFRGLRVLDIGCGEGRTAHRISRKARSVLGVDPDPGRIALARQVTAPAGAGETRFLAEDVVTFNRPPTEFDAVVFTRSL
jgi:ubiquinone/menaquinone biosynthesis C-methylase UbiE